jgi:protein-arginine kinase activator protein McsA
MKCEKCKQNKIEICFSYKNKSLGIRKKNCKEFDKEYRKVYYETHRFDAIEYSTKSTKLIRKRNTQFIWDFLELNPCIQCGEKDPIVLEFDHRDNLEKTSEVSRMVSNSNSIQKIKEEIEKCDVRCANCHRRKTAKQFGWYKNINK